MDQLPQSSRKFSEPQAKAVAEAFKVHGVDYLFIGKAAAIILGYPAITQDLDLFLPKSGENAEKVIKALQSIDFQLSAEVVEAIHLGKDFVQIKSGPFDIDLIHAPDGIKDYKTARGRRIYHEDLYPVASLRDIISSKRASGRAKDLLDLYLLEAFAKEYERAHPVPLRSVRQRSIRTLPDSHSP